MRTRRGKVASPPQKQLNLEKLVKFLWNSTKIRAIFGEIIRLPQPPQNFLGPHAYVNGLLAL